MKDEHDFLNGDSMKPIRADKRWFHPKKTDDLRKECLPWIGREVTVTSWHNNVAMTDDYPNDDLVGFVKEFACDVPQSELRLQKPEIK